MRLPAGKYRVLINSTVGFYSVDKTLNVLLPTSVSSQNHVASFAGGLFWINGSGISPSSYITINGLNGYVVHSESSLKYYYQLP